VGTGGMTTKLQAATIACASGTTTLIARADDAAALLGQEQVPADLGTWFEPTGPHRPSRRLPPEESEKITDDAMAVEAAGRRVVTVRGHMDAFKITTPMDLRISRALYAAPDSSAA